MIKQQQYRNYLQWTLEALTKANFELSSAILIADKEGFEHSLSLNGIREIKKQVNKQLELVEKEIAAEFEARDQALGF